MRVILEATSLGYGGDVLFELPAVVVEYLLLLGVEDVFGGPDASFVFVLAPAGHCAEVQKRGAQLMVREDFKRRKSRPAVQAMPHASP